MTTHEVDVVVLGLGPGGEYAAQKLAGVASSGPCCTRRVTARYSGQVARIRSNTGANASASA